MTGKEKEDYAIRSAEVGAHGSAATLPPVIAAIKSDLIDGVRRGNYADLAFIGNSSNAYPWTPCLMVDIDVFLFANELNEQLGSWLLDRAASWRAQVARQRIDFELRVIEGPYKPAVTLLERPIIVLHLGVFTELRYLASPPLKRWAWRKYSCVTEPNRLERLAPPRPDLTELLYGPKGVEYRLNAIASGSVTMNELVLPSFREVTFSISLDEPNFAECCFAYSLSSSRNHGRILGFREADSLPNETYFQWYNQNVLSCPGLLRILQIKMQCRDTGFDVNNAMVQTLAVQYLKSLSTTLEMSIQAQTRSQTTNSVQGDTGPVIAA
jgi:hypothetical protein